MTAESYKHGDRGGSRRNYTSVANVLYRIDSYQKIY